MFKNTKFIVLCIVLWVCLIGRALAQKEFMDFKQLTIEQGISVNTITCIRQDSIGYVWIGTVNGLNRFDGYEVKNYFSSENDSTSLIGNTIQALLLDQEGTLWIGTRSGICRYVPQYDRFKRYALKSHADETTSSRIITSLLTDGKGTVWATTMNGSLFRHRPKRDDFEEVALKHGVKSDVFSSIFDKEGNLWMGLKGALLKYVLPSGKYTVYPIRKNDAANANEVHRLIQDDHYIWMAVYRVGAVRFDMLTGQMKYYTFPEDAKNRINNAFMSRKRQLWFATGAGLLEYNRQKDRMVPVVNTDQMAKGITGASTECVFQDRQNNLWVGTKMYGVSLHADNKAFAHLQMNPYNKAALTYNDVKSISMADDGNILLGSTSYIDVLDRHHQRVRGFPVNADLHGRGSDDIWKIYTDREGRTWVGSYSGGLQRFFPETGKIEALVHRDHDPASIGGNDIRGIAEDHNGGLWLAVHGSGIARFDPGTKVFTNFDSVKTGIVNLWTNDVFCDSRNTVWISSFGGLGSYDIAQKEFKNFYNRAGDSTSLSDDVVRTVFEDSKGRIWVGTDRGLDLLNNDRSSFRRLLRKDGLPNDHVCAIQEDHNGYLWISTNGGGLVKFDKEPWVKYNKVGIQTFDKLDGIQSNEFYYNSSFKDKDGNLYFGGANGLTVFDPDDIVKNQYVPRVIISDLKLLNQSIKHEQYGSLGNYKNAMLLSEVTLPHNIDMLTFEFTAFNYVQPEKNQYAYKMVGFDKSWYHVGTKREATYTNLSPGTYFFRVKASNNDGVWNEQGAQIKVNILPPWWNTLYFRLAMLAVVLLFMYALFLVRTRHLKVRHDILQSLVRKKTLELELQNEEISRMAQRVHEADESKIRFFMNVSHEFKTPLSLILSPLEQLLKHHHPEDQQEKLHFMHRNAQRLKRLINQLLDMRKLEVGQVKLSVEEGDLKDLLKEIYGSFQYVAAQRGLKYQWIDASEGPQSGYFDADILEKVFFNLLSNALKYTPTGGEVVLRYHGIVDGTAKTSVSDSGVGISEKDLEHIFDRFYTTSDASQTQDGTGIGLALVKELLQLHHGEVSVSSSKGQGTVFEVTLPLSMASYSEEEMKKGGFSRASVASPILPDPVPVNGNNRVQDSGTGGDVGKKETTILLVEDDEELRPYLYGELSKTYRVIAVCDGLEALHHCRQDEPDLVLSDIMMPKVDGLQLCKALKSDEQFNPIPVILLTAKTGEQNRIQSYEFGADAYIAKPFSLDVLKARIENLVVARRALLKAFLANHDLVPQEVASNQSDSVFLRKAVDIVKNNLSDPELNYEVFARELGMGKTKLYDRIGKITGQSINIFIRTIRVKIAAKLLLEENLAISEVSYRVGFNDPNYFAKCFRKQFQQSPKEFLQNSLSGKQAD